MSVKKDRKRIRLTKKVLEYVDVDYWNKLGPKEEQFMRDFIDGYYNNNHGKYDVFTDMPDYDEKKSMYYSVTNNRNSCMYTDLKAKGLLFGGSSGKDINVNDGFDSDIGPVKDFRAITSNSMFRGNFTSDMLSNSDTSILEKDAFQKCMIKLETMSVDEVILSVVEDTLDELNIPDRDHFRVLISFYQKVNRLLREERRVRNNDKKIARERRERESTP